MELILPTMKRRKRLYLHAGVGVFISTLFYYLIFRSQLPWPGYVFNLEWAHLSQLTDHSKGGYPSFAFALSMGLIAVSLFAPQRRRVVTAILGVWVVGLLHEVSMGTFATTDVFLGTAGAAIALLLGINATKSSSASLGMQSVQTTRTDHIKMFALLFASMSFAMGSSEYESTSTNRCLDRDTNGVCIERQISGTPVYLSYDQLRSAVKVTGPRALASVSRIYLYKNLLFANEMNEGIHIIDNTVPTSPKRIGFIEIPGNTEIAIRDGNLYADSYIDLVTFDVSNTDNITEIARAESSFPYNSRQNIPANVRLVGSIDSSLGVVVGYR